MTKSSEFFKQKSLLFLFSKEPKGSGERKRVKITQFYWVRTDIPPEVVCALSEGQVALAWLSAQLRSAEGVVCLATAKRGNDYSPSQAALATL